MLCMHEVMLSPRLQKIEKTALSIEFDPDVAGFVGRKGWGAQVKRNFELTLARLIGLSHFGQPGDILCQPRLNLI